jgi:hypothetical protein
MEKKLIIVVALFVICSTGSALAVVPDVYQWFGSLTPGVDVSDDWTAGNSWLSEATGTHGLVPTAVDRAKVNSVWGNPGPVVRTPGVQVGEIFISEAALPLQTLTIAAGGDITTGGGAYLGQVNIGYSAADTGELIADGGTANITQHLWLGWNGRGILQMNSGLVSVGGMFAPGAGTTFGGNPANTGFGEVHLDGGLLHTAQWWGGAGFLGVHNYSFDISGGTWEIHGWWETELQELKDSGWITAYGGTEEVMITWDPVREITTVTPEPITLSLLGLGALLLRRRS